MVDVQETLARMIEVGGGGRMTACTGLRETSMLASTRADICRPVMQAHMRSPCSSIHAAHLVIVAGLLCTPEGKCWDGSQGSKHNKGANDDDGDDASPVDVLAVQAPVAELLLAAGGGAVRQGDAAHELGGEVAASISDGLLWHRQVSSIICQQMALSQLGPGGIKLLRQNCSI